LHLWSDMDPWFVSFYNLIALFKNWMGIDFFFFFSKSPDHAGTKVTLMVRSPSFTLINLLQIELKFEIKLKLELL